jgi:RNA polymerase sigma factor FliA
MKHDQSALVPPDAYASRALVEERVRRFLPLVRRAAWHIHGSGCDGLEADDLVQAGLLALTECARRHAGPSEDGFAAYAKIRVRGAMFDLVRRTIPGSRGAAARRRRLQDATVALRALHGREPSTAELADALGIAQAELGEFAAEPVRTAPLDGLYDETDAAFADPAPDPFAELSQAQDSRRLADTIAVLPERLKLVLQLYFVEEMNLSEIAEVLSISIPRVHQLKAQALKQVRAELLVQA